MEILGVYPINAAEPCHLVEVIVSTDIDEFDWGKVTQEGEGQPLENWQIAYDENPINVEKGHWVFFFHYLNLSKPLITPEGKTKIPKPSELPDRLKYIEYEEP
ncbi:hypothetical protein [Agaribacter flavus]|uniref:Uncharacterized protein n=1 Tax=Agaribacter flavus TaxID=1902781 RepID=A0ABV7FIS8_9ALTE